MRPAPAHAPRCTAEFVFTVMREPEFLAVLTGVGEAAYRRADGVLVIPLRALGA